MQNLYLQLLAAEVGEKRQDSQIYLPRRFNGKPDFLLEPYSAICHPFGKFILTDAERIVQNPSHSLLFLIAERQESLTQWAVTISEQVAEYCHAAQSVMMLHSCLSEDVSTSPASRIIDVLGLSALHSLGILGEPGNAWVQALECAGALCTEENATQEVLMLAGEKWCPPFRRYFGDLFALSDAMTAVLLRSQLSPHVPCIEIYGWAACAASIIPRWLYEPVAVDIAAWSGAVEAGLAQTASSLGLNTIFDNRVVLGPELGIAIESLGSRAPHLTELLRNQHRLPNLPGHFGACDPFVRLHSWAMDVGQHGRNTEVLAWSAGPGGEVGMLHGVLRV